MRRKRKPVTVVCGGISASAADLAWAAVWFTDRTCVCFSGFVCETQHLCSPMMYLPAVVVPASEQYESVSRRCSSGTEVFSVRVTV